MSREPLDMRPAGPGDAPAIAPLVHACFSTYRSFMGPGWAPPTVEWTAADLEGRLAGVGVRSRVALRLVPGGSDEPAADGSAAGAAAAIGAAGPSVPATGPAAVPAAAFCAWMPARTDAEPRAPVAGLAHLWMLFVEPRLWGSGVAGELLEWAQAGMVEARYHAARLWTPTGQARARAFYERRGWSATGRTQFSEELGFPVVEYRVELTKA